MKKKIFVISIIIFASSCSSKKDVLHYYDKGKNLVQEKKYDKADQQYQKAIDLATKKIKSDSLNWKLYYHRGLAESSIGDLRASVIDFKKVILLNPEFKDAYFKYSGDNALMGQHQVAIDNYNIYLFKFPNDANAFHYRGVAYISIDENVKGCEDLSKAISLGDSSAIEFQKMYCK